MLSVALCSYNGEKFLSQQLNSILNQSKPVDEIIICDDNSTDSTIYLIEKFQIKFPQIIKLYRNPSSLGPIKNFEKAINLCSGELIFLSDQDDIWKSNKVEFVVNEFLKSPSLEAFFSDAELIDENSTYIGKTLWSTLYFDLETQKSWTSGTAFREMLYKRNKITGATLTIKRDLFYRAIPFPIVRGVWHDAWLGIHAAANRTLAWTSTPLIQYRIHPHQQVGIGNGTTLVNSKSKINFKEFLTDIKHHYQDTLYLIDKLCISYPALPQKELHKDAINGIMWIDFRLNLPKNILTRTFSIIKNLKVYSSVSKSFLRTIIKDILSPAN